MGKFGEGERDLCHKKESSSIIKSLKKGGKNMKEVGRYDTEVQMFVQVGEETNLPMVKFMRWLVEHQRLEQPQAGPAGGDLAYAAGLDNSENERRKGILSIQTDMRKNLVLAEDIDQVFRKKGEGPTSDKLSGRQTEPIVAKANQVDLNPTRLGFLRWLADHGRLEHPVVGPPSGEAVAKPAVLRLP